MSCASACPGSLVRYIASWHALCKLCKVMQKSVIIMSKVKGVNQNGIKACTSFRWSRLLGC